jgi:hypothetical protein
VVSLERLLVRIAPQLAPADYALIEKLVRTLLGLLSPSLTGFRVPRGDRY